MSRTRVIGNTQFLKRLQSDPYTTDYNTKHWNEISTVKQKFLTDWKNNGAPPKTLRGAFGPETVGSDSYVEEILKPETGGTFLKLYGCSYLHKGHFDDSVVHGLQLAKSLFSHFLRHFLEGSYIYAFAALCRFVLQRRKFYEDVRFVLNEVDVKVMQWYDIPEVQYNVFAKELKRVAAILAETERPLIADIIRMGSRFLCLFLEADNTYRYRVQNVFGNVNKEAAQANGTKEFFRLFDLWIQRENISGGIRPKLKFIRAVLRVVFLFSPLMRRLVTAFLVNLDAEQVKLDEADRYFALRFRSFSIDGIPFERREALWKDINKLKGHVFLI